MTTKSPKRRITVDMRLARFDIPPVRSALVVGRNSGIGPQALEKALLEMMPGSFRRIDVEDEVVQSVLINEAHLRRIPQDELIPLILRNVEGLIDPTETLHVDLSIEVQVREELEI